MIRSMARSRLAGLTPADTSQEPPWCQAFRLVDAAYASPACPGPRRQSAPSCRIAQGYCFPGRRQGIPGLYVLSPWVPINRSVWLFQAMGCVFGWFAALAGGLAGREGVLSRIAPGCHSLVNVIHDISAADCPHDNDNSPARSEVFCLEADKILPLDPLNGFDVSILWCAIGMVWKENFIQGKGCAPRYPAPGWQGESGIVPHPLHMLLWEGWFHHTGSNQFSSRGRSSAKDRPAKLIL